MLHKSNICNKALQPVAPSTACGLPRKSSANVPHHQIWQQPRPMSHCKSIQQKAAGSFRGRKRKSTADSANCSWESDLRFGSFSTKPLNPKLSAKGRVCSSGKETRIRKRGNQNLPVLIFISCFKPRRAPSCFSKSQNRKCFGQKTACDR